MGDCKSNVIVRRASLKDIPQIFTIEKKSFDNPWSQSDFKHELLYSLNSSLWVAVPPEKSDTVAGVICFRIIKDEAYIMKICVREDYRCQGIGGRILETFFSLCRVRGILYVALDVDRKNQVAEHFYRQNLFEPACKQNIQVSDDSTFVMIRKLKTDN